MKLTGKISERDHYRWQDNPTVKAKYARHRAHPDKYPALTKKEREELNAHERERRRLR